MCPSQALSKPVKSNSSLFPFSKSTKEYNYNHINSEFVKEYRKKLEKSIGKNLWNNNN